MRFLYHRVETGKEQGKVRGKCGINSTQVKKNLVRGSETEAVFQRLNE